MLNTMTVILGLALVIILFAYALIVLVPLFATFFGWLKLRKIERGVKDYGENILVNYHEKLGFTMADGGEKEKKEG